MFKQSAIGNLLFMFVPIVLFILFSLLLSIANNYSSILILLSYGTVIFGFGLFFYTKLINFKSGHIISFGSKKMTKRNKVIYYSGYLLMAVGLMGIATLLLAPNLC